METSMAYVPLPLPGHVPEPLMQFVTQTHERFLWEVHHLLALPGIKAGGPRHQLQFTIAAMLLNVISAASQTLATADRRSGDSFKHAMRHYYPWETDQPTGVAPHGAPAIIYSVFRNPMSHTGMARSGGRIVKIGRLFPGLDAGRLEERVEQLERAPLHGFSDPSIVVRSDAIVLWVDQLYWGVRTMICRMLADPADCGRIIARIRSGRALAKI
jgi:hypothetical protein